MGKTRRQIVSEETNLGPDMNSTNQVDINLICNDIIIERNADVLLNACKNIGIVVNKC